MIDRIIGTGFRGELRFQTKFREEVRSYWSRIPRGSVEQKNDACEDLSICE